MRSQGAESGEIGGGGRGRRCNGERLHDQASIGGALSAVRAHCNYLGVWLFWL